MAFLERHAIAGASIHRRDFPLSAEELRKIIPVAITWFQEKKLSLGKAADLAGCNWFSFMDILAQKGIVIFDCDESIVDSE
jgi:predicted HTH domain antitoxin